MAKVHTGVGQCGAVGHEVRADPIMLWFSHRTLCQKQSGSAFGMAMVFGHGELSMKGIEPADFIRQGPDHSFRCYFCPQCGSRICHQSCREEGYPFLRIEPGTLDDTDRAAASLWDGAGHYSSEFPLARLMGRGPGGLVRLLGRAFSDWCCRRRRAAAIRELQKLDDRMLEDIGLSRGEITAALDGRLDGGSDQQRAERSSRRVLERGRT